MSELWRLSATDLAARIRARDVSAREVASDALARLDAVNPRINAVVECRPDAVLARAEAVDAALGRGEDPGILAGVPVTVKVNTDQAGFATTNGLRIQKDLLAQANSPVVDNLLRAGAVVLGRTNTPAFSLRWFTTNGLHGDTRNPRDPSLTPGGSSGGAAAAVTAGIGALAHGTDIGGSIRYPAYACGVHGLRPTLGRVAAFNASGPERGIGGQLMAVSGPIARTIADLRLGLEALSGPDLRDPWYVPAPLVGPEAPKRAALCVRPDGMPVEPEVEAALRDAANRLQNAGWTVVETALPPLRPAAETQAMLWMLESRRAMPGLLEREGDEAARTAFAALSALAPQVDLDGYIARLSGRATLLREWLLFLERYPVALMPASGALPFPDGEDQKGEAAIRAVVEAQLTQIGLPALGLPGLVVSTGLVGTAPTGVQLVASRFREDLCLAAGEAIEAGGVPPAPVDPR